MTPSSLNDLQPKNTKLNASWMKNFSRANVAPGSASAGISFVSRRPSQGRLAVTAVYFDQGDRNPATAARLPADAVIARIGLTCRTASGGRRAVRALAEWAHSFQLTEPDFQVLWCLRLQDIGGLDQTTLARELAYSPAQVSATVERMRAAGWIIQRQTRADRRRHLWQLSESGQRLLNEMLAAAGLLHHEVAVPGEAALPNCRHRGAA
jgi:DNA-binding MarR family transcriptional regulator